MDFTKNETAAPTDTVPPAKRLRRTRDGKMIAGVCSGTGDYLGVDPNVLRLGLGLFTLLGGAGVALYAIAWVLIPEEGAATSIGEDLLRKAGESPQIQDLIQKTKDGMNKHVTR
ncbi:PspC domain-containing protein [Actinomadura hibisca]|uniref:PspC domain-containing protein n=1 Tax=Actinomadura hibisca TaxID=68565 RepID=UPI000836BEF9|nr:PspC domain-containing protein [Actinomadura hibisca]